MIAWIAGCLVALVVLRIATGMASEFRWLSRGSRDIQREIWEREYDLGFRDDPPPQVSRRDVDLALGLDVARRR